MKHLRSSKAAEQKGEQSFQGLEEGGAGLCLMVQRFGAARGASPGALCTVWRMYWMPLGRELENGYDGKFNVVWCFLP